MLHIRVVTAPGLTGRVVDRLFGLPGIRNLIVLEDAARLSPGDAVFLDVDHGAPSAPSGGGAAVPATSREVYPDDALSFPGAPGERRLRVLASGPAWLLGMARPAGSR